MTSTPWGTAKPIASARVAQRAGQRRFATLVEVLETADGERLVRIAYTTDGSARRGPVTLRPRDLARLRQLVSADADLRQALLGEARPRAPRPDSPEPPRRAR
jgi:hypothetical protein